MNGAPAGEGDKGMVLPFDPLHLTFHDLNYYVDLPKVITTCHVDFQLDVYLAQTHYGDLPLNCLYC